MDTRPHNGGVRTRVPTVLAVAWLAAVAVIEVTGADLTRREVGASPDTVADGALWRLLTSALLVDAGLPALQIAIAAAATALVLVRHGPVVWWLAALAGHVGSALLAYAIIAIADALGSASADHVQDDWDYGISCVLAGLTGALFAGAARRLRAHTGDTGDKVLAAVTALALVAWVVTIDWYGVEHVFAFALGALVVVWREPASRSTRSPWRIST
jgi:hypothetical protein